MNPVDRCETDVPDGGRMVTSHRCLNRAKGTGPGGMKLCGVHLAAIERRKAKDAKFERKERENDEAEAAAAALAKRTGLDIEPDYLWGKDAYSPTHVVIAIADLETLLSD